MAQIHRIFLYPSHQTPDSSSMVLSERLKITQQGAGMIQLALKGGARTLRLFHEYKNIISISARRPRPVLLQHGPSNKPYCYILEQYALFQATIVHNLSRTVNLAEFKDINEEQAVYIEQYKNPLVALDAEEIWRQTGAFLGQVSLIISEAGQLVGWSSESSYPSRAVGRQQKRWLPICKIWQSTD